MRPRIKLTVERIETPTGDLILLRPNGADLTVVQPNESERELLVELDGTRTTAELERRFGATLVRDALEGLTSHGLIEDAAEDALLSAGARARFDRQLRYLGDVTGPDGPGAVESQRRLEGATVAVLGTGGLGGRAALELAAIGVGEIRLADGDRVELSNLNRQIQFDEDDVGLSKVERTAARLRSFNSKVVVTTMGERIEGPRQLAEFIAGADLVIDAADWPAHEFERWCNEACFEARIPYLGMSHYPPMVRVGPLYVPGETGCYACQEIGFRRDYPLYDHAIEQRVRAPAVSATLGPACGVTGGLVVSEALHFLTGVAPPITLGAAYTIDLRTMALDRHEVVAQPQCPVCSAIENEAG
jgi:molybdopterin-synthase adenylyltransferase